MNDGLDNWPPGRDWLTAGEVARLLEMHPQTVWRWIRYGVSHRGVLIKLEAARPGRTFRVSRPQLAAFLAACKGVSPTLPAGQGSRDAHARPTQEEVLARLRGGSALARR